MLPWILIAVVVIVVTGYGVYRMGYVAGERSAAENYARIAQAERLQVCTCIPNALLPNALLSNPQCPRHGNPRPWRP